MTKELRSRPHMIIKHLSRPAAHARTEIKGWKELDESYLKLEEIVSFSTKVHYKDIVESTIVIDILNKKVVKNRYGLDDFKIMEHYSSKYEKDMVKALNLWSLSLSMEERQLALEKIEQITKPDPADERKVEEKKDDAE